ncbi:MAG: winged helix-turn-helix domain-containing protein [Vicinamibacterales bacterium]|nr:winged helix-turn-helix domain-containing protein [Vicinamibacterales bacterium]
MTGPAATAVRQDAASAPLTCDFRVDGWLIRPSRNRLEKGPTSIRVRPQLIDVLACLAAHPGQVVSKDQLLSIVWNDRFVAESGVARCVAELRQLLADDARKPRVIETISKRGYRLIAPVESLPSVQPVAAAAPLPAVCVASLVDSPAPVIVPAAAAPPPKPGVFRQMVSLAHTFVTTGLVFSVFLRQVGRTIVR